MILIIDNYDSFTYNLYQLIAQSYSQVQVIRNDKITLQALRKLGPKGIVLSPGPGHPESAGISVPLIKSILKGGFPAIPTLGICLGHQALAYAAGAKIIHAPEVKHGEASLIFHTQKGFYQQLPLPFEAARYHSLMIDEARLPDVFEVEARCEQHLLMGIRHKALPLTGFQFHPESILTPIGSALINAFIERCIVQEKQEFSV